MSYQINIQRIKAVARALQGLGQPVVFVGGAVVSLYATTLVESSVGRTDDVDVIVELATYGDYSQMDQKLRKLGFENDIFSGVICRYRISGIVVDIMPLEQNVLGFSNRWYSEGFGRAIGVEIEPELKISIFSAPYFIASKLEAFKARGGADLRTSTDFEDIIYLFENSHTLSEQLLQTEGELRRYLQLEFGQLIQNPYLEEGIYAHLTPSFAAARYMQILTAFKRIGSCQ